MLAFAPVTIADREVIEPFLATGVFRNCDASFANLFSWEHFYHTTYAIDDNDALYVRFRAAESLPGYLFPLGSVDLAKALERLMRDAAERGDRFRIYAVTREMFRRIEAAMPGRFRYEERRAWFEYIYSSDDLIRLAGRKFQSKRNHIHRFRRRFQWEYVPITREIIPDCLRLYELWCAENGGCKSEQSLVEERIATERVFAHYEQLGLTGGALRIDGRILAYSYGQELTGDTFGVHAEKCLYEIDGGFAMMNQQFAERNCAGYRYINREEDLGLESLRRAKLSYHPAILLEKGFVEEL
jgi:hypothetical protein